MNKFWKQLIRSGLFKIVVVLYCLGVILALLTGNYGYGVLSGEIIGLILLLKLFSWVVGKAWKGIKG